MNVSDIQPAVEYQAPFDLYTLNRIADCSGCYCLTNASGDILYVGQALSVRQRLIQHFDSEKRSVLTAYGRVSAAWWRSEVPIKLSALERGWTEAVRLRDGALPPLNKISAPT
jgi:predicted GIY-YIG superfamily endonuclease